MSWTAWLLIQSALYLGLAPLIMGFIKKAKAYIQGRRGPDLWQPYRDLAKLWGKETVTSRTASWITRATPSILFATTLTAAVLLPTICLASAVYLHYGDILTVVYLLAAGNFFLALAGLDAGSAFGGMGSSRESLLASLLEPGILLALAVLVLTAGSTSILIMVRASLSPEVLLSPAHLLALGAIFLGAIAETGRIPVDNPDTHLELTMIHEGMLLEYTGRPLAIITWAMQVRQLLVLTVVANLYFPWGIARYPHPVSLVVAGAVFLGKILLLGGGLALVESVYAKMRLFRLPGFLWAMSLLGLLALASRYLFQGVY